MTTRGLPGAIVTLALAGQVWEIVAKQLTGGSSLTLTWKIPLSEPFTSPPFPQAHLFTQALSQGIKATQQGLPESQFGGPFLCAVSLVLEHKLNKTCPEISLVVPPDFHLGNPRTLNTGNRTLEGNPRKPTSTEVNSLPRVTELEWVTTGFNSQTLTTVLYNFLKTALSALFFCSRIRLIPHNSQSFISALLHIPSLLTPPVSLFFLLSRVLRNQ